jgi:hypothetical protein
MESLDQTITTTGEPYTGASAPSALSETPPPLADNELAELMAELEAGPDSPAVGIDFASGTDESVIVFTLERLDVAHRLPVVSVDAETKPAPMAPGSITVFKSAEGENMELVLAWARDLQHKTDGVTKIDPATGMALAAQPFKPTKE